MQLEEGLSAIVIPFSLTNPLVRYCPWGVSPDTLQHATDALIQELRDLRTVPGCMIDDVHRYLQEDPLLSDAEQVTYI